MPYNKIEYSGKTLLDLTADTVTPETLLAGETAHDKAGNRIQGSHVPFSGRYEDLEGRPMTFPPAAHTQGASTIQSGTFGGQVNAAQGWQAPGAYLLRNSKLSAVDENPTANGQVCVGYGGAPSKTMIGGTIYPIGGGGQSKLTVLFTGTNVRNGTIKQPFTNFDYLILNVTYGESAGTKIIGADVLAISVGAKGGKIRIDVPGYSQTEITFSSKTNFSAVHADSLEIIGLKF